MTALWMLLAVGLTYRVTMLVVYDAVTEAPREAIKARISGHGLTGEPGGLMCRCGEWWPTHMAAAASAAEHHVHQHRQNASGWRGYILTLLGCPWCVSVWVGAAVVATAYAADGARWWEAPALALTASAGTGLLARAAHP